MHSVVTGHFLDTNIVFDAIYENRPFYQTFQKFYSKFLPFNIGVTLPVMQEVHKIAARSAMLLVEHLHNEINTNNWDNLTIKDKERLLNSIRDNLAGDQRIDAVENKKIFVLDAFKAISQQLISSSKDEIINLLPDLPDDYTKLLQQMIVSRFVITPVDSDHPLFNDFQTLIKLLNEGSNAFKDGENGDYEIFSNITLLILCGAKYSNWNTTSFTDINFYCNDRRFIINIKEINDYIKSKARKSVDEEKIEIALSKIKSAKPY
jgi:hypothetical protein